MKIWDILWSVLTVLGAVAVYVVFTGDLGTPAGWLGPPGLVWLIGATIFVSGWILVTWSMIANPFFEKTVRIQREHGHRVIDSGTYAYVRHPGYVGFNAMCLSTPVPLGSVWTALPIAIMVLLIVIRTVLEDRMLHAELPGYAEYATKVRFRLIPRVW
jgi:protein-S-isoprenylcysteine O-methyltransferase Ste14